MKTLIRKTFPKIRVVERRGEVFFQVDCRRTGTSGKQEHFSNQKEAEKRATEVEVEFNANGHEGLALSQDLRAMALRGEAILAPYGKTVAQACEFFRDYLKKQEELQRSALVETLAKQWHGDKASGRTKKLRARSLADIKWTSELLADEFKGKRILEITTHDLETYIHGQKVGLQRKFNLRNLMSQFLNWCVAKEHIAKNPADKIEIEVGGKTVAIFAPDEAENLLGVCEARFPDFVLYHAICLFAGLRPDECQLLTWEQIHLKERTIHVLAETSKIKEARNVHIETNLLRWLKLFKPAKASGYVTPQKNFKNRTLQLHIAAGYRGTLSTKLDGKVTKKIHNADKPAWAQDICRHSYGSYWLASNGNRAQLAENMGNSIQIIKKHYKRVVSKADAKAYWSIVPAEVAQSTKSEKEEFFSKV